MEQCARTMIKSAMRESLTRLFRITRPPVSRMREPDPLLARSTGWQRRVRIMMQHTGLIALAAVLLCAGVGGVAYYFLSQPTTLRFAVGPPNSEDVKIVQAITAQLARDRANIRLIPEVVDGGPTAAAAAIDNGKADLAVVRRDVAMPHDGQVVAILRRNIVVFVVPSS